MKRYGLIGKKVGHSWSEEYFTTKFAQEGIDACYRLYETDDLAAWLASTGRTLDGFNVTIPYKCTILPLLDEVDPIAATIGAVNTVVVQHTAKGTRMIGYNTDWIGFMQSIQPLLTPAHHEAIILGKGGAAKAVAYAMGKISDLRLKIEDLRLKIEDFRFQKADIVVNCTPVGMWPNVEEAPEIPYEQIQPGTIAFDCIYTPTQTAFMQRCQAQGAVVKNGLEMLHIQAEESWRVWNVECVMCNV